MSNWPWQPRESYGLFLVESSSPHTLQCGGCDTASQEAVPKHVILLMSVSVQDMSRSPIADIKNILKSGGKFFPSTSSPLSAAQAPTLPEWRDVAISGKPFDLLADTRHKISLLTVCFSAYAEPHVESFRRPFLEQYASRPGFGIVDVRPLMSRLKWLIFSGVLKRTLRQVVPEGVRDSLMVAYRPRELLERLEVPNHLGSYVYLIDGEGRVRWRASGQASAEDLSSLTRAINAVASEQRGRNTT